MIRAIPAREAAFLNGAIRELGARIRTLRLRRRRTLKQVAAATGLSISMVSMVERGQTNASIGTLVAIAAALDAPMVSLFGGTARATRPVIDSTSNPS